MTGRRLGVALGLGLTMLVASPASAQPSESDPTIVVMDGLGLERRGLLVEDAPKRVVVGPTSAGIAGTF